MKPQNKLNKNNSGLKRLPNIQSSQFSLRFLLNPIIPIPINKEAAFVNPITLRDWSLSVPFLTIFIPSSFDFQKKNSGLKKDKSLSYSKMNPFSWSKTSKPTNQPTNQPTKPTNKPTNKETTNQTNQPTNKETKKNEPLGSPRLLDLQLQQLHAIFAQPKLLRGDLQARRGRQTSEAKTPSGGPREHHAQTGLFWKILFLRFPRVFFSVFCCFCSKVSCWFFFEAFPRVGDQRPIVFVFSELTNLRCFV